VATAVIWPEQARAGDAGKRLFGRRIRCIAIDRQQVSGRQKGVVVKKSEILNLLAAYYDQINPFEPL
jgi:hypothetical protein